MTFKQYRVVPLQGRTSPRQCAPRDADYWGLFGIDEDDDAYAIGDFSSSRDAEFIMRRLLAP